MKTQNKKGKLTCKYYNHIPNNLLVTKNGFHAITYKLLEKGVRIKNFIPLTF